MDWIDLLIKGSEAFLALLILVSPWLGKWALKQFKSYEQKETFNSAVLTAYLVVHQIARKTENKIDDKIAKALEVLKDTLGKELSEDEKKDATIKLKAIHEAAQFPHLTASVKDILKLKK